MIFIGGIHGVGKSFFSHRIAKELKIGVYSSSLLIEQKKQMKFSVDKLSTEIDDNQKILLQVVAEKGNEKYLLDSHFCLTDGDGQIKRIPKQVFELLAPQALILLEDDPRIIVQRRYNRDKIYTEVKETDFFQKEEERYFEELVSYLKIPYMVCYGQSNMVNVISFVREQLNNGK